ncbi:MAG: hypothetical protein Q4A97_08475 [Comamonadaceae bacterium]|nr:hypothetical protein [Comamonadaceae bacterium]
MAVAKITSITQGQFNVSAKAGTLQPGCVYIIDRQHARLALTAHMSVGLRDEVNWADIQGKPDFDQPVHWDDIQGKPDLGGPVQWADVQGKPAFGNAAMATLTTSREDNTNGRVLRVGDFSIGTWMVHAPGRDLNNLPMYNVSFTGNNLGNNPVGAGYTVVHQWVNSTNDILQFVSGVHTPDEQIYYRRKRTGHWRPWQRLVLEGTPQELHNKTLVAHREKPYRPAAGSASNNTIDLDDPAKGLQYLMPTAATVQVLSTQSWAHNQVGRTVRVWLRPSVPARTAAHPDLYWPHGRNTVSQSLTAGRVMLLEFQCVQFDGLSPFWMGRIISSNWPA